MNRFPLADEKLLTYSGPLLKEPAVEVWVKKFKVGAILFFGVASWCMATQPAKLPGGSTAEPISGTLLTRKDQAGQWKAVQPGSSSQSDWLQTAEGSEAVVAFAGKAHMRMAENTTVHVTSSTPNDLKLVVLGGKVLADVPLDGKSTVSITTPKGTVHSSGGSLIVDVDRKDTQVGVLDGSAAVSGKELRFDQLGLAPGVQRARIQPGLDVQMAGAPDTPYLQEEDLLALEGPDVRGRKKRPTYVKGEETGPKRVGEDEVPTTPSPSPTPPPAMPEQTVVKPPPPRTTPTVVEGGGEVWPYLVGAAAVGTGLYFLLRDDEDNNNVFFTPPFIPTPASP